MMKETTQVLASECWLQAPLDTVEDSMEMNTLNALEVDIVKALVKWGQAQVQVVANNIMQQGVTLRDKIEPCLKLIRFKGS